MVGPCASHERRWLTAALIGYAGAMIAGGIASMEVQCWGCPERNIVEPDPNPLTNTEHELVSCQACGEVIKIINAEHVITFEARLSDDARIFQAELAPRRVDGHEGPRGTAASHVLVKLAAPGTALLASEARILQRLQPGRTPRVVVHGRASDRSYLVMNDVGARTLEERDDGPTRPPDDLILQLDFLVSLADEIARIHGCGVRHRDIKPANIVVQEISPFTGVRGGAGRRPSLQGLLRYRAVPIDLGSAVDEQAGTRADWLEARGHHTCPFAPIEQISSERRWGHDFQEGPATDVHAVAAVALELLTGTAPFERRSQEARRAADTLGGLREERDREYSRVYYDSLMSTSELAALDQELRGHVSTAIIGLAVPDAVSDALTELLVRALSALPAARFSTMTALREALVDALALACGEEPCALAPSSALVGRIAIVEEWVRRGWLANSALFLINAALSGASTDLRLIAVADAFCEIRGSSRNACAELSTSVTNALAG